MNVEANQRLDDIARQLREGETAPPVSVRDFLRWFYAKRRGYWIVRDIRHALSRAGLKTEPDFESAYIDAPIEFSLGQETTPGEQQGAQPPEAVLSSAGSPLLETPTATRSYADPTFRISKLAAANNPPLSVKPDSPLQEAVTLMLINGFSQLPVMTTEREVKGVVSWSSIGARQALGRNAACANDAMEPHQELRADSSLFQAIPVIVEHQNVPIRGSDNRVTGIVTASDLSLQFQQLAEPFLLLSEIENQIRRILADKFSSTELADVRDPSDSEREVKEVADLTFGEYVRLLEAPERWQKAGLAIDRAAFIRHLDRVRRIRNDVMHFDPDGIPPDDLDQLRLFARFLARL